MSIKGLIRDLFFGAPNAPSAPQSSIQPLPSAFLNNQEEHDAFIFGTEAILLHSVEVQEAIARLRRQIDTLRALSCQSIVDPAYKKWRRDTEIAIERIFGPETRHLGDFNGISFITGDWAPQDFRADARQGFQSGKNVAEAILVSMIDELEQYPPSQPSPSQAASDRDRIFRLCHRFHLVARQLRQRHDGRPTLDINDEYDVQDLIHALLKLEFDDVRPEEWTPSMLVNPPGWTFCSSGNK